MHRPLRTVPPLVAAVAVVGAVAALAPGLAPAHSTDWSSREEVDPFDGTVLTVASTASRYLDSRLHLECVDRGGRRTARLRLVGDTGLDAVPDVAAAGAGTAGRGEVLLRVDRGPVIAFRRAEFAPVASEGGGSAVALEPGDPRAADLVDGLRTGDRVALKVVPGGGGVERLHVYELAGSAGALAAPLVACDRTTRSAQGASTRAATAVEPAAPVGARAPVPSASPDPVRADGGPSTSDLAAARAALPAGVSLETLIDRLESSLASIEGALAGATDAAGARAARPGLAAGAEELAGYRGVYRRLPAAAQGPLAEIARARGARVRALAGDALATPGVGAALEPALGDALETLAGVGG